MTRRSRKESAAVGEGPMAEKEQKRSADQTYRVHFSCENTGRYIRSSKRRIRWVFGFRSSHEHDKETTNEEHDIQLLWSVTSGKTRVVWNQCQISSILREGGNAEVVEFTWKTQSNDVLKVVAHSSSSGVVRQYDLWINGVLFSQLFTLTELMRRNRETVKAIETAKQSSDPRRRNDSSDNSMGSVSSSPLKEMGVPSSVRLSMAGLHSESTDDDDELRSELYSSALDEIRLSVTSYLPQTEDMISRAIVEVFISEEDTGHSSSSSLYVPSDKECCHHEVNALYETLEWTRLHNKDASREDDHDEMVLAFLQKQIMNTIRQIRKEQISSQAAIRILVGVAALLDLPLVRPMVQGTVLLEGCGRDCTGELRDFLSRFGIVEWCSVSRKNPTFACCRFAEETSVVALLEAVRDNQQVPKNLAGMSFTALSSNSARSRTSTEDLTSSSEHCDDDDSQDGPLLTKPDLIKSVSHDTASSTCASLCSMYSHHFLLEG